MHKLSDELRALAVKHGCAYREELVGDALVTRYSLRELTVTEQGDCVKARVKTDFVALKRLFLETASSDVKRALLEAARPCAHCISDKCTTLLMAPARTLSHEGKTKKICSMWGQRLELNVTEASLPACLEIIGRFLKDAAGEKHADMRANEITYAIKRCDERYIVGYRMRHSPVSPSDEDFVKACLPKMAALCELLGIPDEGRYIGAIDNFVTGAQYDFLFGVMLEHKPDSPPEGVITRKLRAGEWAVYNSSLSDYPSIWKHYTQKFYALEKLGFDRARIPFEYYDKDGNWHDVHIPVDADEPEDAARIVTLERLPDLPLAGFESFGELDHPDHVERPFDEIEEIKRRVPGWHMIVLGNVHQLYGKPIRGVNGVIIDDGMAEPEGLDRVTMKGGMWKLSKRRHFNGWSEDWAFDVTLDSRISLNECQHPRSFNVYYYNARGGYTEIGIPVRPDGETRFEIVELPPMRVFGKLEDPLNGKTVPDAELSTYYDLAENDEPGTLIVGFKVAYINNIMFYAEPLIKGVPPSKLGEFVLPGGRFMKIWEVNPDGTPFITHEPGWDVEWGSDWPNAEHSETPDTSRHCRMLIREHGLYFEYYLPIL